MLKNMTIKHLVHYILATTYLFLTYNLVATTQYKTVNLNNKAYSINNHYWYTDDDIVAIWQAKLTQKGSNQTHIYCP